MRVSALRRLEIEHGECQSFHTPIHGKMAQYQQHTIFQILEAVSKHETVVHLS